MSTTKRVQGDFLIESLIDPESPNESSRNPELHTVNIKTSILTVDGDIKVLGDTIVEDIIERSVVDPVVLLNSQLNDDVPPTETIHEIPPTTTPDSQVGTKKPVAGLEVNRGLRRDGNGDLDPSAPRRINVQIRYNDSNASASGLADDAGLWEASHNGLDFIPLGGTRLEDDLDPHLGGDLVVNGHKIVGLVDVPLGDMGDIVIESDGDLILTANANDLADGSVKVNTPLEIEEQLSDPTSEVGYNIIHAKTPGSGGTGLYVTTASTPVDELVSRKKAIIFGLIF